MHKRFCYSVKNCIHTKISTDILWSTAYLCFKISVKLECVLTGFSDLHKACKLRRKEIQEEKQRIFNENLLTCTLSMAEGIFFTIGSWLPMHAG